VRDGERIQPVGCDGVERWTGGGVGQISDGNGNVTFWGFGSRGGTPYSPNRDLSILSPAPFGQYWNTEFKPDIAS